MLFECHPCRQCNSTDVGYVGEVRSTLIHVIFSTFILHVHFMKSLLVKLFVLYAVVYFTLQCARTTVRLIQKLMSCEFQLALAVLHQCVPIRMHQVWDSTMLCMGCVRVSPPRSQE